MTLADFRNKWDGVACDFDGYYGAQCVDLFNQYNQDVIGAGRIFTPTTGGAADLWNDYSGPGTSAYVKIANSPEGVPAPGDVIVWDANTAVTGGAGHVAMAVEGCDQNTIFSFDQNYPIGSLPHVEHHPDYTGVLGWLHPLVNDVPVVAPAPVIEPAPQPVPAPVEVPAEPAPASTPVPAPETPAPVVPAVDATPVPETPAPELPVLDVIPPFAVKDVSSLPPANLTEVTPVAPRASSIASIIDFLDGKKTIIGITVGSIYSLLIYFNVAPSNDLIWTLITAWTGVSARLAIDKMSR